MPVTGLERGFDRRRGNIVRHLPDTESELRNGIAVVKTDVGLIGHGWSPFLAEASKRWKAGGVDIAHA
jgi:hypothetical protein